MSAIGGASGAGGLLRPDESGTEIESATHASGAAEVGAAIGRGSPATVDFTEEMHGTLAGPALAAGRGENFRVHLTIDSGKLDDFLGKPDHLGGAKGYVDAPGLGGRLPIDKGEFRLFRTNPGSGVVEMRYDLWFKDKQGQSYLMRGTKFVHDDPGFDVWKDTTTLHTKLYKGDSVDAPVAAEGTLRLNAADLAKQLTTFRAHGGDVFDKAKALGGFFGFFIGKLADVYAKGKFPWGRP